MQLPNPGHWFQTRYELGELLGKGGFAAVYRAVDHDIGREVAIKILMPDHNGYEQGLVQRFMREGRIVAGLQDPHTITMFDFGRTETDLLFMVFEYVPGSDLSKLLIRTGPMPELEVIHILQQLLSALREAHGAGILHRDIKPANVLVHSYMEDDRRVKLLDFGIAKPTMQEGEVDELEEATKSGMSPGTPRYMSPEQIYGDELTPASDIFSLGLVAYEMLSGKPAVQGRTTKETLLHQLSDTPIQLPPFLRVSPELRAMVDCMTRKRPNERFQTTQEVMQHLNAVANISMSRPLPRPVGSPIDTVPVEPLLSPKAKEKLGMIGLVAAAVIIAAAIFVPVYKLGQRALDRADAVPLPIPKQPTVVVPQVAAPLPDLGVEEAVVESGCGVVPPSIGRTNLTATMGVLNRRYAAYVPREYDPDHKHPIVVFFHDVRGAGGAMDASGLSAVAEREKFIVVAPEARLNKGTRNPWSLRVHVATVQAVIDDVATRFCADRSRVFVVAHGEAGEMAESIACKMPISGIATTSYLPESDFKACTPLRPTPQIQLIGKTNHIYTVTGTSNCRVDITTISYLLKTELGYARNRCDGDDVAWKRHKHGSCVTRACDSPFVSCIVDDAYEFERLDIPFIDDEEKVLGTRCINNQTKFDVPATIWEFFAENGLPVDP